MKKKLIIFVILLFIFPSYFFAEEPEEYLGPLDFEDIKDESVENKDVHEDDMFFPEETIEQVEKSNQELKEDALKDDSLKDDSLKDDNALKDDALKDNLDASLEEVDNTNSSKSGTVSVNEERGTRRITISGSIGVAWVFRDDFFSHAIEGGNSKGLDGDLFDVNVKLSLDIQLMQNVTGVLELQNENRRDILHRSSLGNHYISNRDNNNDFKFNFEKAYIQISKFLSQGISFKVGIIPQKFSLRADGESFFLNLGEAESPFGDRADTHSIGTVISYKPIDVLNIYIDGFYFITSESSFDRRDENIFGVNFDFYFPKSIRDKDEATITLARLINLMFAGIQSDNNSPILSVGLGIDYFLTSNPDLYLLELYGEALFQWGDYNRKGKVPAFSNENQDHLAFGGYGGFKFTYRESKILPFLDLSFWYISGDDDDPNSKTNRDLVTYEDINSTVIMEENDYGLDVDSNYWAIKCKLGFKLSTLIQEVFSSPDILKNEELKMEILYAHFRAIDVPRGRSHKMGDEIDAKIIFEYSPDLTFDLQSGFLFNSDYFKEMFKEQNISGKSNAFLLRIGTTLRF